MRLFAFDFETELIAPGRQAPPPICMSFATDHGTNGVYHAILSRDVLVEKLRRALSESLMIGANTAFDMLVTCSWEPELLPLVFQAYDEGRVSDVLIRQKLADIAVGEYRGRPDAEGNWTPYHYSLASVVRRHLGVELDKSGDSWRLRYAELADKPISEWPPEAFHYSLLDSTEAIKVWEVQRDEAAADHVDIYYDEPAQCRADFALKLASAWGLRTDPVGVAHLKAACERDMSAILPVLQEAGIVRSNGSRSVRAAQQRMIDAVGIEQCKLTATGVEKKLRELKYIALDEEACRDSGDDVLNAYAEYQTIASLLNGHVVAMESGIVMPIHTRFEVLLNTGRTSSSDPNVQNVRRREGARECFVPRPGHAYVGADYDKGELHTLAQVCLWTVGGSELAKLLNAGIDCHTEFGATLADTTYAELLARVEAGDEEAKEWRQRAKAFLFGAPGGMSPGGLIAYAKNSYGVILAKDQAEQYHRDYFRRFPCVGAYHEWVKQTLGSVGEGSIKHFMSQRWRGGVWFTTASNSFFQGLLADAAKAAMWAVSRACYVEGVDDRLYGCRVVNFIHDEIILEVPLDRVHEAAEALAEIMAREGSLYTPDVPLHATAVAMDRWSKKAKRTLGPDGRLQVWHWERKG